MAAANKVGGWDYDAAGSVLYSDDYKEESTTQTYTYNAAGSLMSTWQDHYHSSTRKTDGEQRLVFLSQVAGEGNTVMGYYIYSSVLGKVLTETSLNGAKEKTYVHDLSGSVIAVQQITRYSATFSAPEVRWEHTDAGGQSYFRSMYNGNWTWEESAELDPLQRAVKVNYGSSFESEGGSTPLGYPYFGDDKACQTMGGASVDCNQFASYHESSTKKNCEKHRGNWVDGQCVIPNVDETVQSMPAEDAPIDSSNAENGLNTGHQYQKKYTNPRRVIRRAIEDADYILSGDNPCARYFGEYALDALAALDKLLEIGIVDNPNNNRTGIRMGRPDGKPISQIGGKTTLTATKTLQDLAYRVFDSGTVNRYGPFKDARAPRVGQYNSASRESRVLQVLHELAHMIYKPGGTSGLLIQDDSGSGEGDSAENTEEIYQTCKDQINNLPKRK
ncbi:MAG: hypothetical protein DMF63_04330 [Acidobacteria bacterium]|nr:MAG: hypothetical protein DMF63_04330 [Acidobacteriota bacterium]